MTGFLQSIITIVLFILILGGLVVIHEIGHFVVARLSRVRVLEFGIGFPPRAKVLRSKGETLRIGYVSSLTAGVLPRALERFQHAMPQVRVELLDLPPGDVHRQESRRDSPEDSIGMRSCASRYSGNYSRCRIENR